METTTRRLRVKRGAEQWRVLVSRFDGSGLSVAEFCAREGISFPFFESREIRHVEAALGLTPAERAVLLSDGYHAYAHYAAKTGITHAQCWTHTRRGFFEAQAAEPEAGAEALALIGELYQVEEDIRQAGLSGERKKDHRLAHAKPVVERFFAWIDERFAAQGLLPSNPLTKALAYAHDRRFGLEVFLTDPDVPIDTNHLERALRVIPMGRRNWMFCWTELGARHVGILQSLIVTCRLHDINPYDYLVDVLQRVWIALHRVMDFAVGDKLLGKGEAKDCARACFMRANVQRFRANKDTRETRVWWIASDTRFARSTPSTLAKGKSHEQHRLPRRRSRHRCRHPVFFRLALRVGLIAEWRP